MPREKSISQSDLIPLNKNFYFRDAVIVAKELLGKQFVKIIGQNILAGKIVEVEAYVGAKDKSAHSFRGKTIRNSVMFERGGVLYVYFIYGVHYCANVVTGNTGEGDAVLIRALEPLAGVEILAQNRFGKNNLTNSELLNITNGPAKLCKAFNINRKDNGENLTGDKFFITEFETVNKNDIAVSKRIGITKSQDLPWRFFIKDNKFVSQK